MVCGFFLPGVNYSCHFTILLMVDVLAHDGFFRFDNNSTMLKKLTRPAVAFAENHLLIFNDEHTAIRMERIGGTHQSHFEESTGGPYWNLKANGGLEANLIDMAMWANAFTSKTILPDSLVAKMFYSPRARRRLRWRFFFWIWLQCFQKQAGHKND